MQAYLIDPFAKTVTKISIDEIEIADVIGCNLFDTSRVNRQGDRAFVDDEGLYRDGQKAFGLSHPDTVMPALVLAGKVVIAGIDGMGETTPPKETIESIMSRIIWDAEVPEPFIQVFSGK